jgi:hypothetical protein
VSTATLQKYSTLLTISAGSCIAPIPNSPHAKSFGIGSIMAHLMFDEVKVSKCFLVNGWSHMAVCIKTKHIHCRTDNQFFGSVPSAYDAGKKIVAQPR